METDCGLHARRMKITRYLEKIFIIPSTTPPISDARIILSVILNEVNAAITPNSLQSPAPRALMTNKGNVIRNVSKASDNTFAMPGGPDPIPWYVIAAIRPAKIKQFGIL